MDKKDNKILAELLKDGRQPYSQIAKKTRMSREVVEYRIKTLEKKGIIKSYITLINNKFFGISNYIMGIRFKSKINIEEAISYLRENSHIKWLITSSGNYDIICIIGVKDIIELDNFLEDMKKNLKEAIRDYEIFIECKLLKDLNIFNGIKEQIHNKKEEIYKKEADKKDIRLLVEIKDNARKSCTEISKRLGITPEAVSKRLRILRKKGIIRGFRPVIDIQKLGFLWFITLIKTKPSLDESRLRSFLDSRNNIYYAEKLIGSSNYNIEIIAKDYDSLYEEINSIREFLGDNLISQSTEVVLEEIKQVSFSEEMISKNI